MLLVLLDLHLCLCAQARCEVNVLILFVLFSVVRLCSQNYAQTCSLVATLIFLGGGSPPLTLTGTGAAAAAGPGPGTAIRGSPTIPKDHKYGNAHALPHLPPQASGVYLFQHSSAVRDGTGRLPVASEAVDAVMQSVAPVPTATMTVHGPEYRDSESNLNPRGGVAA